jgi:hypothetical protein
MPQVTGHAQGRKALPTAICPYSGWLLASDTSRSSTTRAT